MTYLYPVLVLFAVQAFAGSWTVSTSGRLSAQEKRILRDPVCDLEMVRVPQGKFLMGSSAQEKRPGRYVQNGVPIDAEYRHSVEINKGFWLGRFEVTQGQWKCVTGSEPWKGKPDVREGERYPAVYVSWYDVQAFLGRLNERSGLCRYRLPTEAEWEYAARARTSGPFAGPLDELAWYMENSGRQLHQVGEKLPNNWSLYDMHGNVMEWVQDWYNAEYYHHSPEVDPPGPARPYPGEFRVFRGGSWLNLPPSCRSAYRAFDSAELRDAILGFRVVCEARSEDH